MRIVAINTCDYGSTGIIMKEISEAAERNGHTCWIAIPKGRHNKVSSYKRTLWIGSRISEDTHIILGRITGLQGYFSFVATWLFLKKLDDIQPDIIHLHNLHNSYINIPMLFSYIKKNNVKVVWTLHDCWAFTGHCPHFTAVRCGKWQDGCYECPSYKEYPSSLIDNSRWMWNKKKKWFSGVKDMVIVTPSNWLKELVEHSFLRNYPIRVINNGIDLTIFKKTAGKFRAKHNLEGKIIILGVAFDWGYRKGLDVFIELSKTLNDHYQIVLVGTNAEVEKTLPKSILSIRRTSDQYELADIYSSADVLLNPTREDNYPTVNMESIACGTPVLSFNTGGSPEIILNDYCGRIISTKCVNDIVREINDIVSHNYCCSRFATIFDKNTKFNEYIELYRELQ